MGEDPAGAGSDERDRISAAMAALTEVLGCIDEGDWRGAVKRAREGAARALGAAAGGEEDGGSWACVNGLRAVAHRRGERPPRDLLRAARRLDRLFTLLPEGPVPTVPWGAGYLDEELAVEFVYIARRLLRYARAGGGRGGEEEDAGQQG